jgi:integrase
MSNSNPKMDNGKSKKRGNGRGTVRQLPSGKWRWEIQLGDLRHSGVELSKALAETQISRIVTDHRRGVLAVPDKSTVRAYALAWLERQQDIRDSTRADYSYNLRYAFEVIGDMKITDVRPSHVKDCLNKLATRVMQSGSGKGKTMSRRTLMMVRSKLRSVFDEAVSDQIIYANPVTSVKPPKINHDEDVKGIAMTNEQTARFREIGQALYEMGFLKLWPALCVALNVGCRRGEVMALRWSDVDFETNTLKVRQNLTEVLGQPKLGKPKTKRSIRDIPIPGGLQIVLAAHKKDQMAEFAACGNRWSATGPVFATLFGLYTAPSNLVRACKNLLEWSHAGSVQRRRYSGKLDSNGKKIVNVVEISLEARLKGIPHPHRAQLTAIANGGDPLPDLRVHDLRHTFATLALRSGAKVEKVSKILGHSSTSITQDIYQHTSYEDLKEDVFDMFATPVPPREVPAITLN